MRALLKSTTLFALLFTTVLYSQNHVSLTRLLIGVIIKLSTKLISGNLQMMDHLIRLRDTYHV